MFLSNKKINLDQICNIFQNNEKTYQRRSTQKLPKIFFTIFAKVLII